LSGIFLLKTETLFPRRSTAAKRAHRLQERSSSTEDAKLVYDW
jgi:hypothetical protein